MSRDSKPKFSSSPIAPSAQSQPQAGQAPMGRLQRVVKGSQQVMHDLFKLQSSKMLKNGGYSEEFPMIEQHEHTHWYHTVDSSGKSLTGSTATGGHHHKVTVKLDASGEMLLDANGLPFVTVSPPLKWVKRKSRGKIKKSEEPVMVGKGDNAEPDEHTHTVEYCGSEPITTRTPNIEAAKFETALKAKHEPSVDGVLLG